jgi:hypothetical protein
MRLHAPLHHHRNRGSLGSRAWVWLHQQELDRQLANGADPASSAALQARAQLIVTVRFRRELAAEIECVLAQAEHPPHWHTATLPVCVEEVCAARDALVALAGALRAPPVPPVRGAALAACLMNDTDGPLYQRARCGEISAVATDAAAMIGCAPSAATAHGATG